MHPYIPYLIADIEAVPLKDIPEIKSRVMAIEEQFEEIERWINGVDEKPFSYFCELASEIFPSATQLTNREMKMVNHAFLRMMASWNVDVYIPKNLPVPFTYQILIGLLNRETIISDEGHIGFDFCTGYAPGCELKEYCPYLEIRNNSDFDDDFDEIKDDVPPF